MGSVGCKAYDLISKDWNTYPVDYLREVSSNILFGLCVAFIFCGTCCFFVKPLFLKGYFDNKFKISDKDTITIINYRLFDGQFKADDKYEITLFVLLYIYIYIFTAASKSFYFTKQTFHKLHNPGQSGYQLGTLTSPLPRPIFVLRLQRL